MRNIAAHSRGRPRGQVRSGVIWEAAANGNLKKARNMDKYSQLSGSGNCHIIALMSGTSVDAIDGVLVNISGTLLDARVTVLHEARHRWPAELRDRILAAMAPAVTPTAEICRLNVLTARRFAALAGEIASCGKIEHRQIAAIASHGQTLCHLPADSTGADGSTLQIGDISTIAQLSGIPTIGNFRMADMAVGGQGAPLAPFADQLLLTHAQRYRCVQNIGGIGNVTFLPPRGAAEEPIIAFDTGPGNMLMDALAAIFSSGAECCDHAGRRAATGRIIPPLLDELQSHPYFRQPPPKSTGREIFGRQMAEKIVQEYATAKPADMMATAAELTAWSIADAYRLFLPRFPDEVIVCGGGLYNDHLMRRLNHHLFGRGGGAVESIDSFGLPNQSREAICFALLGWAFLKGFAGNLPAATGAHRAVICGQYARP